MKYVATVLLLVVLSSCTVLESVFQEPRPTAEDLPDPVERGDIRFFIMSDLNSSYGSTDYQWQVDSTVVWLPRYAPDMILSAGDLVAGQDRSLSDDEINAMWEGFERHIADSLRSYRVPYAPAMGNHDGSNAHADFQRERNKAKAYFNRENVDWGINFVDQANFPFWYSFEIGDIFFVVWDATSARIPEENLKWVEDQLQSERAQQASMRMMMGHLSLYPVAVNRNRLGELLHQPDELLELMEKYEVHTYISGHNHGYYPGRRGDVDLLNSGALGSGPRQIIGSPKNPRHTFTIVDVWPEEARTVYTTIDARTAEVVDKSELPRYTKGVNGYVIRRDLGMPAGFSGKLHEDPFHHPGDSTFGQFTVDIDDNRITVDGSAVGFTERTLVVQLGKGSPVERDKVLLEKVLTPESDQTGFELMYEDTDRFTREQLKAGLLQVVIKDAENGRLWYKGSIVPEGKIEPPAPSETDIEWQNNNLKVRWNAETDPGNYPVHYIIQVSNDPDFERMRYTFHAGAGVENKELRGFRKLLMGGDHYLRVIATDGKYRKSGETVPL